ncbi:MAG: asparagine synthase (glutamine-hydrolyzing) [Gammaproteobacteria bacterium]
MCGIAGILGNQHLNSSQNTITRMTQALRHRGPDALQDWSDCDQIYLGHARLSIIDLSTSANQPMHSVCGRYAIVFNGEIYNYKALKLDLDRNDIRLKTNSDTEVLLETIAHFGVETSLKYATGMFAFALWDKQLKTLTLARDRFGEKPLYYGNIGGDLVFASELKSFREHPEFKLSVNSEALKYFFKYDYIPAPYCILDNCFKLEAGQYLVGSVLSDFSPDSSKPYWIHRNFNNAQPERCLEQLLSSSVSKQLVADVPVGCFLSGGIDSSLITALAQQHSEAKVNTFTMGFKEKEYDESNRARAVAKFLGANHHEWIVTQKDILDLVPSIAQTYDEPFADASQLPTTLLSRKTRESVKVCLSGDGGDELFGGYNRYVFGPKLSKLSKNTPELLKGMLCSEKAEAVAQCLQRSISKLNFIGAHSHLKSQDKLQKLFIALRCDSEEAMFDQFLSTWPDNSNLLIEDSIVSQNFNFSNEYSFAENMMFHDAGNYLVDGIMTKIDRAAMSVGLETRAPFLDKTLYECAMAIPAHEKIVGKKGKMPLRGILKHYIPESLINLPKSGFSVPLEHWFRNELRELVESLLSPMSLRKHNYFNEEVINNAWKEHITGRVNQQYKIWNIVVFQLWYEDWAQARKH